MDHHADMDDTLGVSHRRTGTSRLEKYGSIIQRLLSHQTPTHLGSACRRGPPDKLGRTPHQPARNKVHAVCWTRPDYPGFCVMYHGKGFNFRYDAPATIAVGTRTLARGAALVGLMGYATSHDIRRGAARELAGIAATGTNVEAARVGLGHSRRTMFEGVTDEYIDGARVTAGRKLEQEHFQAWLAEQEATRNGAPSPPTTAPECMMPPGQSTSSTEGCLAESDLEGDMPIDPVLGNLQSLLFGEPSDAQEAIVRQTGLAAGHSVEIPDSCKVISADRAAFMTFFSQVNATTAQLPAFNRRNHMPSMSGHTSRSEPSRHQWRCANHAWVRREF